MRYSLAQPNIFVRIRFSRASYRFSTAFFPWEDTLHGIDIVKCTCTEHHKVPGEWSDTAEYDGFVFTDDEGTRWVNQYPKASYGQLDDSADYRLRRSSDYYRNDMSDTEFRDAFDPYTDVTQVIDNLHAGARQLRKEGEEAHAQALDEHRLTIERLLEQQFGVRVRQEPYANELERKLFGSYTVLDIPTATAPQAV